jgi:hypothetical protein
MELLRAANRKKQDELNKRAKKGAEDHLDREAYAEECEKLGYELLKKHRDLTKTWANKIANYTAVPLAANPTWADWHENQFGTPHWNSNYDNWDLINK